MNNIRSIRRSQYLTLQDVSDKTGLSISTISSIERGISNPTLNTLTKIALCLNIRLEDLIK